MLFAKVAEFFSVPITVVRRVCYRFHNGEHLIVRYEWQVRDGDEWREGEGWRPVEPVTEFPGWRPD